MNIKITTALFDLDGVLINSAPLVRGAFDHTFAAFNIQDTRTKSTTNLSGLTIREVYGMTASGEKQLDEMIQTHASFQMNNLHLVEAFSDVVETLSALRQKGIHTGVITNRSINARHIIEHCGFAELIDLVVSVEDVKNPKPHPEGILKAMEHFKSQPSQTIMVGDMAVDIIAGKGAGVITVGVDTTNELEELKGSNPDYFVHSLKELLPLFFEN